MAKNKMRKCIVCGKEYEYCSSCRAHAGKPAWMALYHDENCRNIMNISTDYMAGSLTKADAKAKLDGCNLTNKRDFKESVIKAVNEIYSDKKAAKSEFVKVEKQTAENI